jgi:N-acetylglucosaminyl-diphospho-decaprenol L-rhamnosyltransferase
MPTVSTADPAENRSRPRVSAVILAHNRRDAVAVVLDRLAELPVDEVVVIDSGSTDGTADVVRVHRSNRDGTIRLLEPGRNVAIAGRNLAAEAATGDYLLMLDDDSYPLPGAIEILVEMAEGMPRLGVVGGLIRDVDADGAVVKLDQPGTFDWWLRGGRPAGPAPADGWPCFFFPEGGSLVRRSAYVEVGGFFEPYFFGTSEVDLATRFIAAGWDVRYQPAAAFDHMKVSAGRTGGGLMRRMRVRNQIWYFALRFPTGLAVRRILAYLLFDLVECAWHGLLRDWAGGIREAWTQRQAIRGMRSPLPRDVLRRAELNRGRLHLRLLLLQVGLKSRVMRRPA